jgi:hypothetical protein
VGINFAKLSIKMIIGMVTFCKRVKSVLIVVIMTGLKND